MMVLLAMTALVFVSGQLYWNQRKDQGMVDSVALAGAQVVPDVGCGSDPALSQSQAQSLMQSAVQVVYGQLGSPITTSSVTGSCYGGFVESFGFSGGYTLTATYPYEGFRSLFESSMSQISPLFFSGITGTANATVVARAVAQHDSGSASSGYAIFSRQQLACSGSNTVQVDGNVYAQAGISLSNGCVLVANSVVSGGVYQAYGNIEVYADPPAGPDGSWTNLSSAGFELQGHTNPACGSTQYTDPNQNVPNSNGQIINPDPCRPGPAPPVANYSAPTYPDPNISPPYSPSSPDCSPSAAYGSGPAPSTVSGTTITEYQPGCYSYLTVSSTAVLAPGLYYFNGQGSTCISSPAACGGLTVSGGGRVYGNDVTLEFAGQASMIAMHSLTSACGSVCGYGGDPTNSTTGADELTAGGVTYSYLSAPGPSSAWCTGTCPDQGLLVYAGPTTNPVSNPGSTGEFASQGLHAANWLQGTVDFANGTCAFQANAQNQIVGQLVCDSVQIQTGASTSGGSVIFNSASVNLGAAEAALVQ